MKSTNHVRDNAPQFRRLLLAWYDIHARDLPWREDRDPYRVWLSEIMLQQTRVAAVIEHYHEFLRRFPTVQKLAAARTSSVLAAWSGLGILPARPHDACGRKSDRARTRRSLSKDRQRPPGIARSLDDIRPLPSPASHLKSPWP